MIEAPSPRQIERDLRLDFFRGLALLIVLVDHTERMNSVRYVKSWMPISLGFSDAAEGFVFISGYVFGMVYDSRIQTDGFRVSMGKAIGRSLDIYIAYLATTAAVLLFAWAFEDRCPKVAHKANLEASWTTTAAWALAMSFNFRYRIHNILGFYAVVLPFMVLLLWVLRRHYLAALTISGLIYWASQLLPGLTIPAWPRPDEWLFNPFAWQLLFFIGVTLGAKRFIGPKHGVLRVGLSVGATILLIFGLLATKGVELYPGGLSAQTLQWFEWADAWCDKQRLGPLRLLHFLSVALLLSTVCPPTRNGWNSTIVRTVVMCGQASLLIYSVGILLAFVSILVLQAIGTSVASIFVVHCDSILICFGVARIYNWRRRLRNASRET